MAIRNDRPAGAKPPSSTQPTPTQPQTADVAMTGADGSTVIPGADGLEGVEELSSVAGLSQTEVALDQIASAKATAKTAAAMPTHNPKATAKVADQGAVARLINDAAQNLKPGESVTLGGKLEAGEALIVEGGLTVSLTMRPDGRLEVKTSEAFAVGVGAKAGLGEREAELGAKIGIAREVTFVVATGAEAAALMAKFAAAKAAQATSPVLGAIGEVAYHLNTKDQVSERKYALTFEAEAELDVAAGALGLTPGDSAALVESPPGTWFLEIEGEVEVEARSESDTGSLDGWGGKGTAKATIRIPIAAPDADVGTPQGMLKHAKGALARIKDAEVTLELRGDVGKHALSGGAVVATKAVKAKDLPGAALAKEGWSVRGEATVGPREASTTVGPGEVEVTANRSVIVYQSTPRVGGNVDDQMKQAGDSLKQAAQVKAKMIGAN